MKRGQNSGNARRENAALLSRKCHKSTREGGTAGSCRGGPGVAGAGGERRTRGSNVPNVSSSLVGGGTGRQVFFLCFVFYLFPFIFIYFIYSLYFISFILFISIISPLLVFLLFLRIFNLNSLFPLSLPKQIKTHLEEPTPS